MTTLATVAAFALVAVVVGVFGGLLGNWLAARLERRGEPTP